jgi:excisionase family DNA binding protein
MSRSRQAARAEPVAEAEPIPHPQSPELERYLSLESACKYGDFGRSYAYRLIDTGKITARKLGKRVMVERASIDRYLRALPKMPVKRK